MFTAVAPVSSLVWRRDRLSAGDYVWCYRRLEAELRHQAGGRTGRYFAVAVGSCQRRTASSSSGARHPDEMDLVSPRAGGGTRSWLLTRLLRRRFADRDTAATTWGQLDLGGPAVRLGFAGIVERSSTRRAGRASATAAADVIPSPGNWRSTVVRWMADISDRAYDLAAADSRPPRNGIGDDDHLIWLLGG
ncbi:hypothetical protein HBB16_21030 [Pseudonocardia sp. MCCB 268]|nr:hypothetical protein [Pseudonocardia cytotoxica]